MSVRNQIIIQSREKGSERDYNEKEKAQDDETRIAVEQRIKGKMEKVHLVNTKTF